MYCFEVSEVTASAFLMRSKLNRIFVYQCMEFRKHVIVEEEYCVRTRMSNSFSISRNQTCEILHTIAIFSRFAFTQTWPVLSSCSTANLILGWCEADRVPCRHSFVHLFMRSCIHSFIVLAATAPLYSKALHPNS